MIVERSTSQSGGQSNDRAHPQPQPTYTPSPTHHQGLPSTPLRATSTRARTGAGAVSMSSSSYRAEFENPYMDELKATAKKIAGRGRGILASDESNATTGKRLDTVGVENTEDNRRKWRELLYTAPGLGQYISGAIMFEETLYQSTAAGKPFVDVLREQNIIPGIKVGGRGDGWHVRWGPLYTYNEWKCGVNRRLTDTTKNNYANQPIQLPL